jgi:DNA polymerase/3'-5' exonuclease PolX
MAPFLLEARQVLVDMKLPHLVAGSYRRQTEAIGDLDVIVFVPDLTEHDWPEGWKVTKARGRFKVVKDDDEWVNADVYACPPLAIGPFALFLTGPAKWNVWLRKRAEARGLLLNQYGLWIRAQKKNGTPIPGDLVESGGVEAPKIVLTPPEMEQIACNGEASILQRLDLAWVTPGERIAMPRKEVKA